MGMGMSIRMYIECRLCGEPTSEHSPSCPEVYVQEMESRRKHIRCPKCKKKAIDVNTDDFYECRECHTQYCTGMTMAKGEDPECEFLLDFHDDVPIKVVVMDEKGKGKMKWDIKLEEAFKIREEAKAALEEE
tara:strand:- start:264 stop:659 length:396 start_codon:yes stop_codon:yes gene_type:complete